MTKNTDNNTDEATEEISDTLTPKELALLFGTTPKVVRKFLRSLTSERPGKGGRWVIQRSDLEALEARFENWNTRSATVLSIDDED